MYRIGGEFKEDFPDVIPELDEMYPLQEDVEKKIKGLELHEVYGKYLWWIEKYSWEGFRWEILA